MATRTHGTLEHFTRLDSFHSDGYPLELSMVPNRYGGVRPFFLCPDCGRRVRFLYLRWGRLHCQVCARLNYKSQQVTPDGLEAYYKGVKLLRERFHVERVPVPLDFYGFFPPKPKGMHWATYSRLCGELRRLQEEYIAVFFITAAAFFGRGTTTPEGPQGKN